MASLPSTQAPGFYRHRVGDLLVTALNDGMLSEAAGVLRGISEQDAAAMLIAAFGSATPRLTVNAFLVQSADMTVLIDTGCGGKMGPTAGLLAVNMAAAGVSPGDVDLVLLTHLHPDHVNGLIDVDGAAVFAAARVMAPAADAAVFLSEAVAAGAPDAAKPVFAMARAAITPYGERFSTFEGSEVAPGIHAVPLLGHSPGHCGFRIASGGEELLIWGDVVHVPDVQAARPEIGMVFDADPELAIRTRRAVFAEAAANRSLVAGMHLAFPGFFHLAAQAEGFRLVPVLWSPTP